MQFVGVTTIERAWSAAEIIRNITGSELMVDTTPLLHYQMAGNVQICKDAFDLTPEAYTNPENLPLIIEQNYAYRQYSDTSDFASALQLPINNADDILRSYLRSGVLNSVKNPAMMFDIDNTLAYTTSNDTDLVGGALPMTAVTDFALKWCKDLGGVGSQRVDCYFFTARYCTALKANATKTWVERTFPKASEEWINSHVAITGGVGGCTSSCSVAYKDVLRAWYQRNRGLTWIMSVGDSYTDVLGRSSGVKVKLPNPWFDSSKVPNSQTQGREVPVPLNSGNLDQYCSKKCQEPPSEECEAAGIKDDQIYEKTTLEYCLQQTLANAPNQIYGCTYDFVSQSTSCHA